MKQTVTPANPAKKNLFAAAKKEEPKKSAKSNVPQLPVPKDLENTVKEFITAQADLKNAESRKKVAEGTIKTQAINIYLQECRRQGRNIGTFKLGEISISIQDRYAKPSEETARLIEKNFPDIIESETEYSFDQDILKKNINAISDALQSAGIPEEELEKLIVANETTTIKKGTIDVLHTYKDNIQDVFEAISPVTSIK